MSGLEVLGGVSAASALAEQGGKLIKFACALYSRYQHPEETQRQLIQVQQLVDLSILIEQNPALQTTGIESILNTCKSQIVAFQSKLNKIKSNVFDGKLRKLKKAFSAVMNESDVKEMFANLEREKTALALCIHEIDSSLLHSIGLEIKDVKRAIGGVADGVTEIRSMLLTINHRIAPPSEEIKLTDRVFYEVPNRRVTDFVGREDVLRRIEAGLTSGTGRRIVVIQGLGGQGKTQIALEYCHRAKEQDIRAIFWVNANSEDSVRKSFLTIATKLKGASEPVPADASSYILETFREWPASWLMVFDNYDDAKTFDKIRDFFPDSEYGKIVVTSRNPTASNLANNQENTIELGGLSQTDALNLLRNQCRLRHANEELIHAQAIVDRLAYHPLAITQAGSYIGKQKIRLDQFMDHYNKRRDKILNHTPQLTQYRRHLSNAEKETSLNVFTTWELSLQQLLETTESGKDKADLLTLFAMFDGKDISEQLFIAYCQSGQVFADENHWPVECLESCLGAESPEGQFLTGWENEVSLDGTKQWDSDIFVEILNDLTEMSLVQSWTWGEDKYSHLSLHPLIKDWIRLRATEDDLYQYSLVSSKVLEAVLRANYYQESFTFPVPTQQVLLSHIDSYKENITILQERNLVTLIDWKKTGLDGSDNWIGNFLLICGRYSEFESITKRLVEFYTKEYGLQNEDTLREMNNLAVAYGSQGKLELAEEIYRQVLKESQTLLGSDHAETLQGIRALANNLFDRGKYQEAENLAREVVKSQERIFGLNNHDTLDRLNLLGLILQRQEKYEECEEVLRRALGGYEKFLGPDHLYTLDTAGNLGSLYQKIGDLDLAEKLMRRQLVGTEKLQGNEHPDTLISVNNLALILGDLRRLDEEEEMISRAIEGHVKALGPEHRETLISVWNLALIFWDQQKYAESQSLYEKALSGLEKALGPGHPNTLECSSQYDELMGIINAASADETADSSEEHQEGSDTEEEWETEDESGSEYEG